MAKLTQHEIQVLRMVAGKQEWAPWGAWLGACLDSLKSGGYITGYIGTVPHLTNLGSQALTGNGRDGE